MIFSARGNVLFPWLKHYGGVESFVPGCASCGWSFRAMLQPGSPGLWGCSGSYGCPMDACGLSMTSCCLQARKSRTLRRQSLWGLWHPSWSASWLTLGCQPPSRSWRHTSAWTKTVHYLMPSSMWAGMELSTQWPWAPSAPFLPGEKSEAIERRCGSGSQKAECAYWDLIKALGLEPVLIGGFLCCCSQ